MTKSKNIFRIAVSCAGALIAAGGIIYTGLCGYKETDTKFGIRVMDPYGGLFRVVSFSSSSDPFSMAGNGHTYTWTRSLVIQ